MGSQKTSDGIRPGRTLSSRSQGNFGLIWAVASFLLLFKVWDGLGPIVLGISKSHFVQAAAMIITYLVIFGVPAWLWCKIFG